MFMLLVKEDNPPYNHMRRALHGVFEYSYEDVRAGSAAHSSHRFPASGLASGRDWDSRSHSMLQCSAPLIMKQI
jgi:hypothetical protein